MANKLKLKWGAKELVQATRNYTRNTTLRRSAGAGSTTLTKATAAGRAARKKLAAFHKKYK